MRDDNPARRCREKNVHLESFGIRVLPRFSIERLLCETCTERSASACNIVCSSRGESFRNTSFARSAIIDKFPVGRTECLAESARSASCVCRETVFAIMILDRLRYIFAQLLCRARVVATSENQSCASSSPIVLDDDYLARFSHLASRFYLCS